MKSLPTRSCERGSPGRRALRPAARSPVGKTAGHHGTRCTREFEAPPGDTCWPPAAVAPGAAQRRNPAQAPPRRLTASFEPGPSTPRRQPTSRKSDICQRLAANGGDSFRGTKPVRGCRGSVANLGILRLVPMPSAQKETRRRAYRASGQVARSVACGAKTAAKSCPGAGLRRWPGRSVSLARWRPPLVVDGLRRVLSGRATFGLFEQKARPSAAGFPHRLAAARPARGSHASWPRSAR